jgi:hypothetical protein
MESAPDATADQQQRQQRQDEQQARGQRHENSRQAFPLRLDSSAR